jgi:DNA-directed RNA polymerase specialized sigma24 family protein
MSSEGSVSRWLGPLRAGDPAAAQFLWERYFARLVGLARQRLQGARRAVADEEDVALSAFASFCLAAEAGRFPQLNDRDSLWRLLMTLTARKAAHQLRSQGRLKRGGGADAGTAADAPGEAGLLEQVLSREPTPLDAALVAEECRRLLSCLDDPKLQALALWRMEGYTEAELAARQGCVPRTIRRKLCLIRTLWEKESEHG